MKNQLIYAENFVDGRYKSIKNNELRLRHVMYTQRPDQSTTIYRNQAYFTVCLDLIMQSMLVQTCNFEKC